MNKNIVCAGSFVEVRFIDFFLCTDWISQYPFRPLVFKDNRRVLRPRLPYCLTVVWVWSNKESVEYRRSRHHYDSWPQLDSLGQYTWLVVSKPCFPANLQQHTLISKMLLLVWESPLLPTDQCLQCLWGRENIFVSFQLLLCYCFSSTLQFSQLPIDELQVLQIRFLAKYWHLSIMFDLALLFENGNRWQQVILKNGFLFQLGTTTSRLEMIQSLLKLASNFLSSLINIIWLFQQITSVTLNDENAAFRMQKLNEG